MGNRQAMMHNKELNEDQKQTEDEQTIPKIKRLVKGIPVGNTALQNFDSYTDMPDLL